MPSVAASWCTCKDSVVASQGAGCLLDHIQTGANAAPGAGAPEDRLESWKKIASYLKRDVSTVQRWERREGMPIHRHLHDKVGTVYAFRSEIDAWWQSRRKRLESESDNAEPGGRPGSQRGRELLRRYAPTPVARLILLLILVPLLLAGAFAWRAVKADYFWRNPLANARFSRLTDLGTEQAAAISRDGKLVAILASRNDQVDLWLGQGEGATYRNLTQGALRGLNVTNPAIRAVGFSPDGSLLSVWTRRSDGSQTGDVRMVAVPTAGGPLQAYLPGAAEADWSHDGQWLVYHTTAPGDPLFVRGSSDASGEARRIYVAPAGVHCHFPVWAPDDAYIYFVRGVPASGEWDIWRVRPSGAALERVTTQNAQIAYPIFIDRRTILYLATDESGDGPWMYAVDVERRLPHRVSSGLESYKSLAGNVDGTRLVATLANIHTSLWRLPLSGSERTKPTLLDTNGSAPRPGRDSILYVALRAGRHGIWTRGEGDARELWGSAHARIVGRPALAADGRVAFAVSERRKTLLYVMDRDGRSPQLVSDALTLRGDLAWAPDGQSLVAAVVQDGEPRLTRISLRGESILPLVSEYSLDPVWSPDGRFLVYYGADVGTSFPVRAAAADGRPYPMAPLMLPRGSRVAFAHDPQTLLVLRVDPNQMTLVQVDVHTGLQRTAFELPSDFVVRDFDVTPDGQEIVLDRVEDNSDVALIERAL